MKNLILAALVIFCTQPISSMNFDRNSPSSEALGEGWSLPAILSAIGPAKDEAPKGDGRESSSEQTSNAKEIVQQALQEALPPNVQAALNNALFALIVGDKCLGLLTELIEAGAQANARNAHNLTPLLFVAAVNFQSNYTIKIFDLLISHGADINAQDSLGYTPLGNSVHRNVELIQFLLEHGAEVNLPNAKGETPLFAAASYHSAGACRALLNYGADIRIKTLESTSPFIIATQKNFKKICEYLITLSRFYPLATAQELKTSQDRILTALLCWKRVCPLLPKDLRRLFLLKYLHDDAINCPTHLCKTMVHLMPPQIACKLLGLNETVGLLKKNKYAELAPLMVEAAHHTQENEMLKILNPKLLEESFGKTIEEVITADCLANKGDIL